MTTAHSPLFEPRHRGTIAVVAILVIIAVASLGGCSKSKADAAIPLFVFAGQSNMLGQGSAGTPLPAALSKPSADAFFWVNNTRSWSSTPPTSSGFYGPDVSAVRQLARRLGEPVLGVKFAASGTSLAGPWNPSNPSGLYADMKGVVSDALHSRLNGHGPPKIAGFFWMQGESDAQNATAAASYGENLRRLIDQVRSDFSSPELPIVLGRIRADVPMAAPQGTSDVRSAIDAASATANVRSVSTDELPLAPDHLHFTGPGLITLGNEFASAYMTLHH
jgi:hypothetical protein